MRVENSQYFLLKLGDDNFYVDAIYLEMIYNINTLTITPTITMVNIIFKSFYLIDSVHYVYSSSISFISQFGSYILVDRRVIQYR